MKIRKNFIINFTNLKMTIYYLFHSIYVKMDKICFNTCIFNFDYLNPYFSMFHFTFSNQQAKQTFKTETNGNT